MKEKEGNSNQGGTIFTGVARDEAHGSALLPHTIPAFSCGRGTLSIHITGARLERKAREGRVAMRRTVTS